MTGLHMLEDARGKASVSKRFRVPLGDERRLLRHLEDHAVPRHERWNHGVHGREIGIVPRCQHQDDAKRLAAKPFLRIEHDVRQRAFRDADHVAGAFLEPAANLQRALRERPAHLPRQLGRELVGTRDHRLHGAPAYRGPLIDRNVFPASLSTGGPVEHSIDVGGRRQLELRIDGAVNGADCLLAFPAHMRLGMVTPA